MKRFWPLYRQLAPPWLCVAVYLWVLDLLFAYASDFSPLLTSLADASVILWTLVFWTLLFCSMIALSGLLRVPASTVRINERIVRFCSILVSSFFLMRWISGWASLVLDRPLISWFVIVAVLFAYFLVRQRRRRGRAAPPPQLPTWEDCFYFGVVPILSVTIVILGIKIGTSQIPVKVAIASSDPNPRPITPSKSSLPNVFVIVADALRAQSMSLYGNDAVLTPSLGRFAASSSVYLESHTNSTMSGPSLTTLLTGRHPFNHGRLTREIAPRADEKNLLHILQERGYSTAAVTSNLEAALSSLALSSELTYPEKFAFESLLFSWVRDLGVQPTALGGRMYTDLSLLFPFLGFPGHTSTYGNVEDTLNRARELTHILRQPYFLFVHIHEPHESQIYPSPSTFAEQLAKTLKGETVTGVRYYARYGRAGQPAVDVYRTEYEAKVRNIDSALGQFFGFLEKRSLWENSLVVFTRDHGESFERGYLGHGEELYENSTWVPLVIKYPGQTRGERVASMTQSVDIAPTILRALAIPVPDWMEGQPLMLGKPPEPQVAVAVNYKHPDQHGFYPLPTKLALWWEQYKLIVACGQKHTELYDLRNDPGEQHNIADGQSALVAGLEHRLKDQLARQPHKPKLSCPSLA